MNEGRKEGRKEGTVLHSLKNGFSVDNANTISIQ